MIVFEIPLRTTGGLNDREHWAAKHRRVKAERAATSLAWNLAPGHLRDLSGVNLEVRMTRLGTKLMDDDNLSGSLKAVRDELAQRMGLKSDNDPRVKWTYSQAVRAKKAGGFGVRVEILEAT